MKIQPGFVAELEYSIRDAEDNVVETSADNGPLSYAHGSDELPPAVASALEGRSAGETVQVRLEPGEAFGPYDPAGIVSVPRVDFPKDVEIPVGDWITLTVEGDDGQTDEIEMRVIEVDPDAVVLDANHPLADQVVTFEIRVLNVTAN